MRLRHQLWLVSLLLLFLPWAGCQFVQETETAMLEGQEQALSATARAVSLRLAEDQSLNLSAESVSLQQQPVYFHALSEAPTIDGFDDEWRYFSLVPTTLRRNPSTSAEPGISSAEAAATDGQALLSAGNFRGLYYIFLRVPDDSLDYLNPEIDSLKSGDYLRLVREGQPDLYLGASAPGNVNARYLDAGQIRPEYGVAGVWNHVGDEYQIELRIRPRLLTDSLGMEFVSKVSGGEVATHRLGMQGSRALRYISADEQISQALAVFADSGQRLSVVDAEGWLLGKAGSLAVTDGSRPYQYGLLTRLYRIILRDQNAQPLPRWQDQGRLALDTSLDDDSEAISLGTAIARFNYGDRKVSQSRVAILRDGRTVGAVVAEQTSDSLTTSTNTAFNRLLFWSLLSMLCVGLGLLLFASLLSWRIGKLSEAADLALDDRGNLKNRFPVSKINDEVGDLSRSYDQLLLRLREYTDYLRTLSGKLSHELRTPLAVVRSSLDNLEQQDLSDEAQVYTARASEGAARLSSIFTALSGASRLEQSLEGAEFEVVDLVALLQTLHAAYVDAYPDTRIRLAIGAELDAAEVTAAPDLLVQMLDKLVDNAVGYCPSEGELVLSIKRDNQQLLLSVSNDGPLLPEEMKSQLFDSLVSVRASDPAQVHLGLGLYIARLIVEAHNGSISLTNRTDGTGVVACVRLPTQVNQSANLTKKD